MVALVEFIHYGTITFAVAINAIGVGIGQGLTSGAALQAINRQPSARLDIIIALFIQGQSVFVETMRDSLRLISSGLAIGLGSVGPAIGLAIFAKAACAGIGINRKAYAKILPFTFISEAIIETPVIFAFV